MQLFQMNREENEKKSQSQLLLEISRIDRKPYQMVHISTLREYLILDMGNTAVEPSFKIDPERLIDDFILLCFFCGNDFLPHMPTLEIREGALNLLISVYQHTMPKIGHLSKGEHINMRRMEVFVDKVSMCEQAIFQKRAVVSGRQKNRQRQFYEADRRKEENEARARAAAAASTTTAPPAPAAPVKETNKSAADLLRARLQGNSNKKPKTDTDAKNDDKEEVKKEEEVVKKKEEVVKKEEEKDSVAGPSGAKADAKADSVKEATKEEETFKRELAQTMKKSGDKLKDVLFAPDKIRLGEDGWKVRYYEEKFKVSGGAELQNLRAAVVRNYVEGLCWVMKYYYQGCPSWSWYFAYHYAPFASDLKHLDKIEVDFNLDKPFKPLDQLMAVLPPASGHCMPKAYRVLMSSPDSPILDFYPEKFPLDPNGKRYSWQHIALLPFIDEKRLLGAIQPLEATLSEEETRRNSLLSTLMVIHKSHPLAWPLLELEAKKEDKSLNIDAKLNNCINGRALLSDSAAGLCPKTIKSMYDSMEDVERNKGLCFAFVFPKEQIHVARPLKGTTIPEKEGLVTPQAPEIWHEQRWQNQGGQHRHQRGGGGGYGGPAGGAGHFAQQHIQQQQGYGMIYQVSLSLSLLSLLPLLFSLLSSLSPSFFHFY